MKSRVSYDQILKKKLSDHDIILARSVSTNLTSLNDKKIEVLLKHAEILTEIQLKLYCPSLIELK